MDKEGLPNKIFIRDKAPVSGIHRIGAVIPQYIKTTFRDADDFAFGAVFPAVIIKKTFERAVVNPFAVHKKFPVFYLY